MDTIKLNSTDSLNYLIKQREDLIEHLNDILKINDNLTEKKSMEILQNIFKINSQIKLEENKLIVHNLFIEFSILTLLH